MWRALRYGLDGRLLDLEAPTIEEFPAAEALRPPEGVERRRRAAARAQRRPAPAADDRRRRARPTRCTRKRVKETQGTYQEETVT